MEKGGENGGGTARTGEGDESPSFSSLSHGWKSPHCPICPTAHACVCISKKKKKSTHSRAHSDARAHTPSGCPMQRHTHTHPPHPHTRKQTLPSQVFPKPGKESLGEREVKQKLFSRWSDGDDWMSALLEMVTKIQYNKNN